ncbi:unnamed protein product [Phytomonas sp. EM1]|nr:unnamed protein product [Phytomonas sp. EM1]|eukprot:CCW62168.1 unnamed protein product [Phytomonas sp. isolate EM1]
MYTDLSQVPMVHTTDSPCTLRKGEDRPWMHGIAGLISGSMAMMLFYPLDLLRTRMHVFNQRGSVNPPPHSIRLIVSQEGLRGMYRGMSVSVLTHGLGWGTYLVTFRASRSHFEDLLGPYPSVGASAKDFLSACVAAVITSTMITPFYVMKTWYQLQTRIGTGPVTWMAPTRSPPRGRNLWHFLQHPEGRRAMFRGFAPQVILTSSTTIQVTLYEWFRRNYYSDSGNPSAMEVALGSALAKAITCGIFNPLEVVRTRLQYVHNQQRPEYGNMRLGLKTIWRNEGIWGMYRGFMTNMTRVIPTAVASFILYERLLSAIRSSHGISFSGRGLWNLTYDFVKKDEDYSISYDDLVPAYVIFFNEAM